MFKTLMISAAVSALMVSGAMAQADKPADSGKFIASQSTDQWVFSKFKGTDVVGTNNEKIGDVGDVLFDKDGKVLAYVISVGGFLGIGSKDVAIMPSSFQMMPATDRDSMKLKLAMTKDELKAAPDFKPYTSPRPTVGGGGDGAPTTGMAPRGGAPAPDRPAPPPPGAR